MTDKEILEQIGLSEDELGEYLRKVDYFFEGLSEAEKKIFLASLGTIQDALSTFQGNIKPEELEAFLRKREPGSATAVFFTHVGMGYSGRPKRPPKGPTKRPKKQPKKRPNK